MVLYLLGRDNVAIKEVKTISSYEIKEDIDFNDSSNIVLADYVHMDDGDFALIKDGAEQAFFGICKEMKPSDSGYKITLKQKENLFDTTIFNDGEELIQSTGIEDYIVKAISDNFISSGDTLMDMDYIQISASTHTPVAAKVSTIVDTDNGVYNLKTFLGNARQNYGILLDFTVENGAIKIDVNCREQTTLNVDTKLPEVADVSETYNVSVLAKLIVKWDVANEIVATPSMPENKKVIEIYPVGSIYMSINNLNPGELFGGTWEQIKDTFLLAAGSSYKAGSIGGESEHKLTAEEIPSHTHAFKGTTESHTHTFTGTAASHNHVNRIFDVNNKYFKMERSGIRLKNTSAYEWVDINTASNKTTAGSTGGDICGSTASVSLTPKGTNASASITPKGSNSSTGGGAVHNNMPPYLTVYMWKRVA